MNQIVKAQAIAPSTLKLTLRGGRKATIDIAEVFGREAFAPLADPEYFAKAQLDPELGGIFWPNGADLSPEYLEQAALAASDPPGPGPKP
ncbi:MAG TPA: DUF2442 domain-containing protein [Dehalococcoidia bacterium]|nr:DUF2442 domain-containing protein [Dehalococcoidia bacterium]